MKILLIPIGEIPDDVIPYLQSALKDIFGCSVQAAPTMDVPDSTFDKKRNQYEAGGFLDMISKQFAFPDGKNLGITEVDLFAPGLNFVFGQARPKSQSAVISLHRLHDDYRFLERAAKEAIHELGHTLGLGHCPDIHCVMHFSNTLHDTDIKGTAFCSKCRPKLFKLV